MLKPPNPEDASRIRQLFAEADYTKEGLREKLIVNELPSRKLRNMARLLDRTSGDSALDVLMRLFTIGVPVPRGRVRDCIPERTLQPMLECGLLRPDNDGVVSDVMLTPFEGLLVASDQAREFESGSRREAVLFVNPTTQLLHRFAVRQPIRSALDLGAGSGALSLVAAGHCDQVTATDLNPRATEFAAFNAGLNGCENVECLTGDTFEPVAGRRFDLIVCNPPFFISPSAEHLFCDSGMDLDLFSRRIVRESPEHLEEGGLLQMICEWAEIQDEPWQDRLAEWFGGIGCDAWVLKGHTEEPTRYAHLRIRETNLASAEADAAKYDEWVSYYRARRLKAIHRGMILLRRRSGKNWVRMDHISAAPKTPFGEAVVAGLGAMDYLQEHAADEALLSTRLQVTPDVRMERRLGFREGRWQEMELKLSRTAGLPYSQKIEPFVAEFVERFDGTRTVGEIITLLSEKSGVAREPLQIDCLGVVRKLLERGFLAY